MRAVLKSASRVGAAMKTIEIYPLIPKPLLIDYGNVHGQLYIEGSLEDNCLAFRFVFKDPQEWSPLAIGARAAGKNYTFYCLIRKNSGGRPSVETPLFQSPFCLSEEFTVTAVKELVKFEADGNEKK
jgi:hypothetical protein